MFCLRNCKSHNVLNFRDFIYTCVGINVERRMRVYKAMQPMSDYSVDDDDDDYVHEDDILFTLFLSSCFMIFM